MQCAYDELPCHLGKIEIDGVGARLGGGWLAPHVQHAFSG